MAVERVYDAGALASDIEALVQHAVRCGLVSPVDAVWAYNTVLEAVGATGPSAPNAAIFLQAAYATSPTARLGEDAPVVAASGDDAFDLEGTVARIAEAGIANC